MKIFLNHFLRYQLPALFWSIIIFVGSSIPAKYLPHNAIFTYDKLIHVVLFMIFGMLVFRAFEPMVKRDFFVWGRMFLSVAIVILYGVLDEVHQFQIPGRTMDVWDALADAVGGILAACIVYIIFR